MVINHYLIARYFFNIGESVESNLFLMVIVWLSRIIFLTLVGLSTTLSIKGNNFQERFQSQKIRIFKILAISLIISIGSYIFSKEDAVYFGVLHLIAVSIFIVTLLPKNWRLILILALTIFILTPLVKSVDTTSPTWYIFGLRRDAIRTLDYFPIFPWLGIVLVGYIPTKDNIYKIFERFDKKIENSITFKILAFMGKNSLIIYLIHTPIIYLILKVSGQI